jgi:type II secretory pathway component GspD/PulD (secretin)
MLRAFGLRHGFVAALALALAAPALTAPNPADTKEKEASQAEKIKKQLDQPVTLDITDQSINAALNQIREQTKINFVVDRFTIQQMGMDPEQMPVSVKLKDVKARSCLRSVLSPYNLGYAIIGDTVLVSTDEMAMHRQMKQRVSIDLEKTDLAAALKKLSKETAANVMLDSRVGNKEAKTEVSLQVEDVPLETAVRLMAEMAGLKPVRVGNVLFVTSKQNANEIRAEVDPNQQGVQSTLPYSLIEGTAPAQPQLPGPPPAPGPGQAPAAPPPLEKKTGDNGDGDKGEKPDAPPKPDRP